MNSNIVTTSTIKIADQKISFTKLESLICDQMSQQQSNLWQHESMCVHCTLCSWTLFFYDILKTIYRELDNFQHSQNKKYDISQIVLTLTIIAYDVKNPLTFSLDNVGKFVKEDLWIGNFLPVWNNLSMQYI